MNLHTNTFNAAFRSHVAIRKAPYGKPFTTRLTVVYTRIKEALSDFYIQLGVSIEAIVTLILVAAFTTFKVMQ